MLGNGIIIPVRSEARATKLKRRLLKTRPWNNFNLCMPALRDSIPVWPLVWCEFLGCAMLVIYLAVP